MFSLVTAFENTNWQTSAPSRGDWRWCRRRRFRPRPDRTSATLPPPYGRSRQNPHTAWTRRPATYLQSDMYIMARQKTEPNVRRHNGFYATPPEALCSNEQERCEELRWVRPGHRSVWLTQQHGAVMGSGHRNLHKCVGRRRKNVPTNPPRKMTSLAERNNFQTEKVLTSYYSPWQLEPTSLLQWHLFSEWKFSGNQTIFETNHKQSFASTKHAPPQTSSAGQNHWVVFLCWSDTFWEVLS